MSSTNLLFLQKNSGAENDHVFLRILPRRVAGSYLCRDDDCWCHSHEVIMTIQLVAGDCLKVMQTLRNERRRFDMIFMDPPFNIGHEYEDYDDNMPNDSFNHFITDVLRLSWKLLQPAGVMCLHGPDKLVDQYIVTMRSINTAHRIAWVNWHYRFGQYRKSSWIDSRCHCLIYARKGSVTTFNADAVSVESDRVKYRDKRAEACGRRPPGTVWGVPSDGSNWGRVQGNNKERWPGHPNQLPEKYLERLILAYTNTGEDVLDPFCGSGTTAVVAQALNRNCVSIDISEKHISSAEKRLIRGSVNVGGTGV